MRCWTVSAHPGADRTWCRVAEGLADLFAGPAHPVYRGLGMVAKLLGHPFCAAALAVGMDGCLDGLPDLPGVGVFTAL